MPGVCGELIMMKTSDLSEDVLESTLNRHNQCMEEMIRRLDRIEKQHEKNFDKLNGILIIYSTVHEGILRMINYVDELTSQVKTLKKK